MDKERKMTCNSPHKDLCLLKWGFTCAADKKRYPSLDDWCNRKIYVGCPQGAGCLYIAVLRVGAECGCSQLHSTHALEADRREVWFFRPFSVFSLVLPLSINSPKGMCDHDLKSVQLPITCLWDVIGALHSDHAGDYLPRLAKILENQHLL